MFVEELLATFSAIEPAGEPARVRSNLANAYKRLPVRLVTSHCRLVDDDEVEQHGERRVETDVEPHEHVALGRVGPRCARSWWRSRGMVGCSSSVMDTETWLSRLTVVLGRPNTTELGPGPERVHAPEREVGVPPSWPK